MISLMDKYIGRILNKLDKLGLAENTVVVFTTDHGHFFGQHGFIHKGPFHYEDMIKIPFIVRYPEKFLPKRIFGITVFSRSCSNIFKYMQNRYSWKYDRYKPERRMVWEKR